MIRKRAREFHGLVGEKEFRSVAAEFWPTAAAAWARRRWSPTRP